MDNDDIFRDYYWAGGQIKLWWEHTYPTLTSPEAMRLYALLALALVAAGASLTAYRAKRRITGLEALALDMKFPGPHPQLENSIAKRRAALEKQAEEKLDPFRDALRSLLVAGFVVPTLAFLIGTLNYNWLDPAGTPFLNLANNRAVATASTPALAWFTLNQFSHGALFDILEVFDIDLAAVSNNPHDYWFSGAVLIYRSMISAFVVALAIGLAQFVYVKRAFSRKIGDEIQNYRREAALAHLASASAVEPATEAA